MQPCESDFIPFNKPFIAGKELFYISQAVIEGNLAGDGRFTAMCSNWLKEKFNARKVLLTHSCTAALEMSALLCGIEPGDEVLMPAYTFVSTANAFALRGASLKFIDIRPDTLNLDEKLLESALTPNTKLIVAVHYAGIACEMEAINDIAKRRNIFVVEDAAQAVNATYKETYLGTIGHMGAYSFHETKNFMSGEGGALLINDERFIERAEIIREKGTNRTQYLRGEIDKYTWVDIGSSYLPSEITAAFLYAQLEAYQTITQKRWEIFNYYARELTPLQERELIRLPPDTDYGRHNAHMFYLIVRTGHDDRDRLLDFLRRRRIQATFHYIPLHVSPMGKRMGYRPGDLPKTEDLSARLVRLPCFFQLTAAEQDRVIDCIFDFFGVKRG